MRTEPEPHPVGGLSVDVEAADDVLRPLVAYARGHATGDSRHFQDAFLPTAHVEGLREGTYVSWDLADYYGRFPGHPAADEASRRRRIVQVHTDAGVGTATMMLEHGRDHFVDVFVLVQIDGRWWIANKAYAHRVAPDEGQASQ